MAIYHLSVKIISRGKGGIIDSEILLPDQAPNDFFDRETLWNEVEKVEKAKNAQLAREIEISLPKELPFSVQRKLAVEFVQRNFVNHGMCADVCFHDKNSGNPHAHIMLTMRSILSDGTWGSKQKKEYLLDENGEKIYDKKKRQYKCKSIPATDWNERSKVEEWRSSWAELVNQYLERNDISERVDHRSYERQGMEQIPTVHLGAIASQIERKGRKSERGEINRQIKEDNRILREIKKRMKELAVAVKETVMEKMKKLAKLLEGIRSHFIVTEYQDMNIDLEQIRLDNKLKVDEKAIERCISIDRIIKNSKDTDKLYELREERIKIYTEAGYTSKREVESAMSVINDRKKAHEYLVNQKLKLSKIKEKNLINYQKELQSIPLADRELLTTEQLEIRGWEEEDCKQLLITQYGERFRNNIFQEAVKRTDEELNGIQIERDKNGAMQAALEGLYDWDNESKDHKLTSSQFNR